jgi:hypothetical protein
VNHPQIDGVGPQTNAAFAILKYFMVRDAGQFAFTANRGVTNKYIRYH